MVLKYEFWKIIIFFSLFPKIRAVPVGPLSPVVEGHSHNVNNFSTNYQLKLKLKPFCQHQVAVILMNVYCVFYRVWFCCPTSHALIWAALTIHREFGEQFDAPMFKRLNLDFRHYKALIAFYEFASWPMAYK